MSEVIFKIPAFHIIEDANFVLRKLLKTDLRVNVGLSIFDEVEFRRTSLDDIKFSRFIIPLIVSNLYFTVDEGFTYLATPKPRSMISMFIKADISDDAYRFIFEYLTESLIAVLEGCDFRGFARQHFKQDEVIKISPLLTPKTTNDYIEFRCGVTKDNFGKVRVWIK